MTDNGQLENTRDQRPIANKINSRHS